MAVPFSDTPPVFEDLADERAERKRQLVLAYRLFAALRWGDLGDGHITARDPERTDHFWLLGYGIAFGDASVDTLVLVGPDGEVVEGDLAINRTAYYIHGPIHDARPDVVAAAHTHTPYGTPWSANARLFDMTSQEACGFHGDHALFDDEEVGIAGTDGGKRIAAALGETRAVILRNHGLLTVGPSVADAIGWYVTMERVAEVAVKAPAAKAISDESAAFAHRGLTGADAGWHRFCWLVASHLGPEDHEAAGHGAITAR